jgi:hypothetical protein
MNAATMIPRYSSADVRWSYGEWSTSTVSLAPNLRVITPEDSTDSRTTDDPAPWDESDFERAPRSVLRRVLLNVLRDPAQRGPWTEKLFPMVLKGTPASGRLVYETLKEFADPQDIIINSLIVYLRYGDAEPLVVGAGLLEDLGAKSWPVLAAYARTARPECAYFVPAIARLNDVAAEERLHVLEILARSGDPELRWRVYEALGPFPFEQTVPVLRALAEGGHTEDSAQFAAEERLRTDVGE